MDAAEKSVRAASAPQDPDSIMDGCLMTGLHLVPDSELPLLTSTFYAKYMLQGKPTGGHPICADRGINVALHQAATTVDDDWQSNSTPRTSTVGLHEPCRMLFVMQALLHIILHLLLHILQW